MDKRAYLEGYMSKEAFDFFGGTKPKTIPMMRRVSTGGRADTHWLHSDLLRKAQQFAARRAQQARMNPTPKTQRAAANAKRVVTDYGGDNPRVKKYMKDYQGWGEKVAPQYPRG